MLTDCGTVEVIEQPPHTVVVQEGCCPPQIIEIGIAGPQGPVAAATFESISKNLRAHPGAFAYNEAGKLASITYTDVVKTFTYNEAGKLATVTLSGAGVPAGAATTKTFNYTPAGKLAGFSYA